MRVSHSEGVRDFSAQPSLSLSAPSVSTPSCLLPTGRSASSSLPPHKLRWQRRPCLSVPSPPEAPPLASSDGPGLTRCCGLNRSNSCNTWCLPGLQRKLSHVSRTRAIWLPSPGPTYCMWPGALRGDVRFTWVGGHTETEKGNFS